MFPVGGPGPRGASREPAGEPPVRPRPRPRGTSRWRNTPGPAGNLRVGAGTPTVHAPGSGADWPLSVSYSSYI